MTHSVLGTVSFRCEAVSLPFLVFALRLGWASGPTASVGCIQVGKNCGKNALLDQAEDDGNAALCLDVMLGGFSSVLMNHKCAQSKLIFFPKKKKTTNFI